MAPKTAPPAAPKPAPVTARQPGELPQEDKASRPTAMTGNRIARMTYPTSSLLELVGERRRRRLVPAFYMRAPADFMPLPRLHRNNAACAAFFPQRKCQIPKAAPARAVQ